MPTMQQLRSFPFLAFPLKTLLIKIEWGDWRDRERQQTDIYAPTYVDAYMQIANAHLT